jgi:hypothetical protein
MSFTGLSVRACLPAGRLRLARTCHFNFGLTAIQVRGGVVLAEVSASRAVSVQWPDDCAVSAPTDPVRSSIDVRRGSALTATIAGVAHAQATAPQTEEEVKLEQDFTDPLTTLPQISIRDAYTPAMYGTHVETNQVIVRPLIPRVPPRTLLPFAQLIRPTFSLVTIPSSGGGTRTEFGDMGSGRGRGSRGCQESSSLLITPTSYHNPSQTRSATSGTRGRHRASADTACWRS